MTKKTKPLVTIGIPTYNRPESIKNTLACVVKQSYQNIEILVSDNCSPTDETAKVVNAFIKTDNRIKFFQQSQNLGATLNFKFVLEKATSDYFMWAADDDVWQGNEFLENLVKYADVNILTFPEAATTDAPQLDLLALYENCLTKLDYVEAFCSTGWGYPFYGLYNLKLFNENNLRFEFDNDLAYYGEGTFLHKLFLAGKVKYVKEAKILFTSSGSMPLNTEIQIDDFIKYFKRTLAIYAKANLPENIKACLIKSIIESYSVHCKHLFEKFIFFDSFSIAPNKDISLLDLPVKYKIITKGWRRVKNAGKILLKGKL